MVQLFFYIIFKYFASMIFFQPSFVLFTHNSFNFKSVYFVHLQFSQIHITLFFLKQPHCLPIWQFPCFSNLTRFIFKIAPFTITNSIPTPLANTKIILQDGRRHDQYGYYWR